VTVTDILPGKREQVAAGMHRTETIDFVFVLSGELVLVEDSGEERELGPGDCVVQLGTRHSWLNPGPEPGRIATVLIGLTNDNEEIDSVL
jgi:mannose-6-phosphate isomerase-like protein (cupin superfamily)